MSFRFFPLLLLLRLWRLLITVDVNGSLNQPSARELPQECGHSIECEQPSEEIGTCVWGAWGVLCASAFLLSFPFSIT